MALVLTISGALIRETMQSAAVREALRARADAIAARARTIAAGEGVEAFQVTVAEGTRPKGRPYARVSTPEVDQEFGTWRAPKLRILGRAGGFTEPDARTPSR